MKTAVLIFSIGIATLVVLLAVRARSARETQRSLSTYRLHLPAALSPSDIGGWLGMVAASTASGRWSLRAPTPVTLQLVASATGIEHFVLVPDSLKPQLLSTLRAGLPGVRLEEAVDSLTTQARSLRASIDLRLTSFRRPLAIERAEATSIALLASLQPLAWGEAITVEWCMCGAGTPPPVPTRTRQAGSRQSRWLGSNAPQDSEQVHSQRNKESEPLLWATMRLGAAASSDKRARGLLAKSVSTLRGMNAPGVQLVRRWHMSSTAVAKRITTHAQPLTRWPLLLNSSELTGLIGFPIGAVSLPGLSLHSSRQLAPTPGRSRTGTVLAHSNYPGSSTALTLQTSDRLRHLYLIGPTGTGKSTLIANMALQDIRAGHGVALFDPKSDLVQDVFARMPEDRQGDVIVLDPAATDQPIGFNLLGGLRSEADRELAVDHVVHIFSELWRDSWGPRTSDVLRNALLTLTHAHAPDGAAFTLVEVAELLTNPSFRRYVTGQPSVPEAVRPFWSTYEQASEAQRIQFIGPALNKLRALTTRTPLRLMLGQSTGLNVADVLNRNKILLVSLSKGIVGIDTAQLLGALLVSSLVNATFARAAMPAADRRTAYIHLDEFQDILRLPLDVADLLAQARGLGVGLSLAHQHLGQLSEPIKRAVLGTARSSVVFQLDYDDAKVFERRFAPLTVDDLMGLPTYEVALRLSVNGQTQRPVTGITLPLPEPTADAAALAAQSRSRYGVPRDDVEAAIRARITPPKSPATSATASGDTPAFGRRKRRSEP